MCSVYHLLAVGSGGGRLACPGGVTIEEDKCSIADGMASDACS